MKLRYRLKQDDGFAIPSVLALFVILMGFSLMVAGADLRSHAKTRDAAAFVSSRTAAETALADALTTANTGTLATSSTNSATNTLVRNFLPAGKPGRSAATSVSQWAWWAERGSSPLNWTVHAIGVSAPTATSGAVELQAEMNGLAVSGVATTSAGFRYQIAPATGSTFAVSTLNETTMNAGAVTVAGYTPGVSGHDTSPVPLSAGGTYNGTGVTGDPRINLFNFSVNPQSERCRGTGCDNVTSYNEPVTADTSGIDQRFTTSCYNAAQRDWTASVAAGAATTATLPAGAACYDNVVFDRNTIVNGTPTSPTVLYVRGSVTVSPGIKVNAASASPYSSQLVIQSASDAAVSIQTDPSADPTQVAWQLWAPKATCGTSGDGNATFFGSITCARFAPSGTTLLAFDRSAAASASAVGVTTVWHLTPPRLVND